MSESQDYLINRLFVEGPDQARFEINNIRASTPVRDVAQGIIAAQYDPKMPDPYGARNGEARAHVVVDRIKEDGEVERLTLDKTLHEQGVRDGDLLQFSPESMAGCFLAGTEVSLPTGKRIPIEQLQVGDYVLSYSFETRSTSASQVIEIYQRREHRYLIINKGLTITPTHFVRINGNWQRAATLKIGDFLQNEQGELIEVMSIEAKNDEIAVYNLNLSTGGTFFAEGVLVSKYDQESSLDIEANFFADGFLVKTYGAKAIAATPFPLGEQALPDNSSLRKWWHTVLGVYGRYSCYAFILSLPSDKEATRYFVDFGDELDLISAADCLLIALSKSGFHIPNAFLDDQTWSAAIDQQIVEGHSIRVADFFGIDYASIPCLVLFRDIRSPEHIVITLNDMSAEEIAAKMRALFSLIHKAAKKRQNPLTLLERERNRQDLLAKGESIMSGLRGFAGKTFETGMEAWIKAVVK